MAISADEKAKRCALAKCPLAGKGDARCADCTGPWVWRDEHGRRQGVHGEYGRFNKRCHSCPMNGKGLPVCWAGCEGPPEEFCTDGQSMVTTGGMPNESTYLESHRMKNMPQQASRPDTATNLPSTVEDAVLILIRLFAEIPTGQVLAFHAMLNGGTQVRAAKRLGISKQAMNVRIARILMKRPQFAGFFRAAARA